MTTATTQEPTAEREGAEPEIVTFGCRLNAYESEVMLRHAREQGLGDAVIVNTCAVTGEAEKQARQAIRRAHRDHPDRRIVVAGCAAQLHPDQFADMPGVERVLGNQAKLRPESFAPEPAQRVVVDDIMEARETASHLVEAFETRTRAFVQIQQGCDHRCTFCIIPYARGNNRSVPVGELVKQVRAMVADGVGEVVLTGVDITAYGDDLPGRPRLGELCRRLLTNVPDLPRLRLSSVDPAELDDEVFALLASEPRLMPQLHLSLQAGDDLILKRMKRRHLVADAERTVERARACRPDVVFGADLIAGFPTEDADAHARTLDTLDRLGLTHLHVFPYDERPGTPAARMPQVPKATRKARAREVRERGQAAVRRFLDGCVGHEASVLLEEADATGRLKGRTEHFAPARVDSGRPGEIARVRVTGAADGHLVAARL